MARKYKYVFLAGAAALLIWYFWPDTASNKLANAAAVETVQVMPQALEIAVDMAGSVRADNAIMLRPEITGIVEKIHFDEGKEVVAGTVLITLDQRIVRAELSAAEAALSLAETNFNRAVSLIRSSAGSERTRDEAAAQKRTALANLELARTRLDKTELKAPFAGVPGLRKVSVGDYVQPGKDLVTFTSTALLNVDFNVPEIYAAAVKTGQSVRVTLDAAPETQWPAVIIGVDPQINTTTRLIAVRARLQDPDRSLVLPGAFARVSLTTKMRSDALMVPEAALIPQGDRAALLVINADNTIDRVAVTSGARQNGLVEITSGLSENAVVIISGQNKLRPGQLVKPLEQRAPDAAKPAKAS